MLAFNRIIKNIFTPYIISKQLVNDKTGQADVNCVQSIIIRQICKNLIKN